MQTLTLRGVRVHNLKSINVAIPLDRLTVVTGVSGAGKRSLVFDTLYAEAQRRYLQSFSTSTRQFLERFDKPDADDIGDLLPAVAIRRAPHGRRATVGSLTEIADQVRLLFARSGTVMCPTCGVRVVAHRTADVIAVLQAMPTGTRATIAFSRRSLPPLFPVLGGEEPGVRGEHPQKMHPSPQPLSAEYRGEGLSQADQAAWLGSLLEEGYVRIQIGVVVYRLDELPLPTIAPIETVWVLLDRIEAGTTPIERLTESIDAAFRRGQGRLGVLTDTKQYVYDQRFVCPGCRRAFPAPEPRLFDANDPLGACSTCEGAGVVKGAEVCPACHGRRLNADALAVCVGDRNIADWFALEAHELLAFVLALKLPDDPQTDVLLEQVRTRLQALASLDLGYLMLQQPAATLSDGALRRLALATALTSNLVNVLYLIDEPTIGLHPRDIGQLIDALKRLRDRGNTVVVIEHDRAIIAAADHVIDLGPGAGEEGGQITYQGPPAGLASAAENPTSDFWTSRSFIEVPEQRRKPTGFLKLTGATTNNLQNLSVDFPLGVLCVVTGVSGAGKRSLIEHTLYPAWCLALKKKRGAAHAVSGRCHPLTACAAPLSKVSGGQHISDVVLLDQEPLPRSSRSNPATYLKIFDEIRELFAETVDAKIRNFTPGHFSFNQPGGRCETCEGQGTLTIDMQFLADVTTTCPECLGKRYRKEILDIKVRSRSIAEVLDLTIREAFRFFRAQPTIEKKLKVLLDVGLDYLRLGQAVDTLAGGEGQRLKLAGHLASSRKTGVLFLLIEPTAGLHPADVANLLDCFERLLSAGHSLIVIDNDADVVACADHVIEIGPGGGKAGGRIVE